MIQDISGFMGQCAAVISQEGGLASGLFAAGLVGGFTHCTGMCGPFVLAQVSAQSIPDDTGMLRRLKAAALIPYHLGRMTTYVSLGILLGGVLNLAFLYGPAKAVLSAGMLSVAGTIFIIAAIPALRSVFPWAGRMSFPGAHGLLQRFAGPFLDRPSLWRTYILGVLLGFLPCGLVLAALMAAASTGSALSAGTGMAAFALGTIPALVLTGAGGSYIRRRWPRAARPVSVGLMVCSGLILLAMAGKMVL